MPRPTSSEATYWPYVTITSVIQSGFSETRSQASHKKLEMADYSEKDIDTEEEWTPPSEAEMKIIQARRERSDRISKIMGGYLLKGYKMLATECKKCGTIELEDKRGKLYCVACEEVDTDINKDDPVLNEKAASSQRAEHYSSEKPKDPEYERASAIFASSMAALIGDTASSGPVPIKEPSPSSHTEQFRFGVASKRKCFPTESMNDKIKEECSKSLDSVLKKLSWASLVLESEDDPAVIAGYLKVIIHCSDAISGLQKLAH